MKIVIFDPSRLDSSGLPSTNLGDLMIRKAIDEIIGDLFPQATLEAISSHQYPNASDIACAQAADLVLVAGTNLLSSHVLEYDQWKLAPDPQHYAEPPNLRAVLLGAGWWQYQDDPDLITRHYYRRLLHPHLPHAMRDGYSAQRLSACGVNNIINTSCPTLWKLNGHNTRRRSEHKRCLFCLTDYHPDYEMDNQLISVLIEKYPQGLIFFPQGSHDETYAFSLPAFRRYSSSIQCLPHDINAFYHIVDQGNIDYIGTRLHAGTYCLQQGLPSLILAMDNRSWEISKDTNLPVVKRGDWDGLNIWLTGGPPDRNIILPLKNISVWKEQLKSYALITLEAVAGERGVDKIQQ
jgi:polysaccharide pyruvyl transferase WcaK-like protein